MYELIRGRALATFVNGCGFVDSQDTDVPEFMTTASSITVQDICSKRQYGDVGSSTVSDPFGDHYSITMSLLRRMVWWTALQRLFGSCGQYGRPSAPAKTIADECRIDVR